MKKEDRKVKREWLRSARFQVLCMRELETERRQVLEHIQHVRLRGRQYVGGIDGERIQAELIKMDKAHLQEIDRDIDVRMEKATAIISAATSENHLYSAILRGHDIEGRPLSDIAVELGYSVGRIAQLRAAALDALTLPGGYETGTA